MERRFFLTRGIDHLCNAGGAVGAFCLLSMALMISYEVFSRYVLGAPTAWVQELSVYLSMAVGFLAAAYALRRNSHFAVTVVVDLLSPRKRRILQVLTNLVGLAYSASFVVKGVEMARFSYEMEEVSSGLLQVPLWIPGVLLPLGGALLTLQFLNKLLDAFRGREA